MRRQQKSIMVLAIIAVFIATMTFSSTQINAGSLEPGDPPGPTMKTMDEIPPTWSQKLPASERFVLVLDGLGVLDKETGLVWEQSPDTATRNWVDSCTFCYQREWGGRKGWRLPTIEELASLVDDDNTDPALPTGHPFSNVQSYDYWSSTPYAGYTNGAWVVNFKPGYVGYLLKSVSRYVWCVRGGYGHDAYYGY